MRISGGSSDVCPSDLTLSITGSPPPLLNESMPQNANGIANKAMMNPATSPEVRSRILCSMPVLSQPLARYRYECRIEYCAPPSAAPMRGILSKKPGGAGLLVYLVGCPRLERGTY